MMNNDFPRIHVPAETRCKMNEIARQFRKEPTDGEKILWNVLRGRKLDGIKFRGQQPIGYFVVDFYSSSHRLVIDVDGPIHDLQREADAARQEILKGLGPVALRINTDVIETNPQLALNLIGRAVHHIENSQSQNTPSPLVGDGEGGS